MAIEFPADPVTGQTEVIDGIKWICEVGATGDNADPDNVVWVRQGNALSEAQPIGSFINFGGANAPAGYLVCDGSEVSQTTYADLFAAIGTAWNTTAGAAPPAGGNFRLPPSDVDGLGLFMRGDGTGTVVGEYQADVFKEHNHPNKVSATGNTGVSTFAFNGAGSFAGEDDWNNNATGDPTETRPRSITTLLCIKATYSAYTGDLGNLPVNSVGTAQIQDEAVVFNKTSLEQWHMKTTGASTTSTTFVNAVGSSCSFTPTEVGAVYELSASFQGDVTGVGGTNTGQFVFGIDGVAYNELDDGSRYISANSDGSGFSPMSLTQIYTAVDVSTHGLTIMIKMLASGGTVYLGGSGSSILMQVKRIA